MSGRRPANQHGAAQFVKRQFVVARRKVPVLVERRQHLASPDATTRLLNKIVLLDINVKSHDRGNCGRAHRDCRIVHSTHASKPHDPRATERTLGARTETLPLCCEAVGPAWSGPVAILRA